MAPRPRAGLAVLKVLVGHREGLGLRMPQTNEPLGPLPRLTSGRYDEMHTLNMAKVRKCVDGCVDGWSRPLLKDPGLAVSLGTAYWILEKRDKINPLPLGGFGSPPTEKKINSYGDARQGRNEFLNMSFFSFG